jgi:uncharacterized protein YdhG (YjbR/CyaY superfamily)
VSDYLETVDDERRPALEHVVDVAMRLVPDAVEGRSYGMPALLLDDRPVIGVVAAAKHLSLFPFSADVVAAVAVDLPGHALSKGTIRFSPERPVPDEVIEKIVRLRLAELQA